MARAMFELFSFAAAVVALLAVPGPTNTLLAAAGAERGVRPALPLLTAELGGYLLSTATLLLLLGPAVAAHPALATALKLAAGGYLLHSAWRLWRGGAAAGGAVTWRRVFATTCLNPKGLVLAFAIFPAGALPQAYALFAPLTSLCGLMWIVAGGALARASGAVATPRNVSRTAAIATAAFGTLLATAALAG